MINGKNVLAVTLARGGSKGIPKKNLNPLCGKPLIEYTIEEARRSRYIDRFVVSTDCREICAEAKKLGVADVIDRPAGLATDTAKSSDALLHALESLEARGEKFDIIVELMVTNPLKKAEHIDAMLELLADCGQPFCVAVQKLTDHHPARIKYLDDEGLMQDFFPEVLESRRQDLKPTAYIRAGSIYCMSADALKETGARYGKNNTVAYVLPDDAVINIDEPIDLIVAEAMLRKKK